MRACTDGPPELLITERTGTMAFAAGALVFPGGRIDADDHRTAGLFGSEAAKVAAIRETIEETGLAPGLRPVPDAAAVDTLREGLGDEEPFASLLAAHGLAIDGSALIPFARWCPNFRETRRFDTLFFLAEAPAGTPEPTVSEHEAVRAFWASAAEVLAEVEAGRAHVIFPTRRNLERLARFDSFAEARADAERHPVSKIVPWVEERDGAPHVCIPEGIGYPVTSEPLETARRR
ncbi:MAG TPA: NUDIX domain-containing protein [Allosphingosinicella sp.]|nr:NUDIX domain-containing protein [Allosphingosinicella sp.]